MPRSEARFWSLVLLVGAMLMPLRVASAQTVTGGITGTVVDAQGAVMPGATVTVLNEATSAPRVAVSDARGDFQVTNLPAGQYTVRVEVPSFRTYERKNVVLSSSERVSVGTITLEVGGLGETVSVEATGTHVNTTETQHGGVITRTQIEQIQVLGRDVTSLMRLLPGVRYTTPVDSMGGSFGVDVPSVGGLPADWSKVIIDGVVGNEAGNSGMQAQMVNLDAIAEVRLLNNSYRAEYGQSGGSQLQIITRGGTSEYRGSGYWYVRNEHLNSTEFFRARSQRLNGVEPFPPKYRFNTYGANLGGPVIKGKNKLFFFYSLEAPIVSRPQSVQTWRMPSALERQGDFSQTYDAQGRLINIKDPRKTGLACNAVSGGPGCFDGNIIPASMINPGHMQAMLNLMPLPEYDPRTTQGNYNYDSEEITEVPKMNHVARVDWRPTSNDSLSFTFKDWKQDQRGTRIPAGPVELAVVQRALYQHRPRLHRQLQQGAALQHGVGHRLRHAHADRGVLSAERGGVGQDQPSADRLHRDAVPSRAEPAQRAAACQFRQHHRQRPSPNFTYDTRLIDKGRGWLSSVRSNLTYVRGAHSIKTGMYFEDTRNSEGKGGVGGGSWSGDFNFGVDTSNPLDTNFAYANALLGNINSYTETDGYADVRGQRPSAEAYVQDTWKPARNLTVDYGVRFLWYRAWASFRDTKSASFDPDRYVAGGSPLLYQPALVNGAAARGEPGHGRGPSVYLRRRVRAGNWQPLQRYGDPGRVGQLWHRLPGQPGHRARGARRPGVGHHRERQDLAPRQHRPIPQPVRERERPRQPGAQPARPEQPGAALLDDRSDAHARRGGGIRYAAERRRSRAPARRADAEEPELLGRHPARDRLGHRPRRHLRRQPDQEHRGHLRHQRPPVWHQLHRRQPAEHQPGHRHRAARRLPAAVQRLRYHQYQAAHRRDRLQLDAGAAQSPLHQGAAVRARLHPRQGLGHPRHQPLPDRRLVQPRADRWHAAAQPHDRATPGMSRMAAACGTTR